MSIGTQFITKHTRKHYTPLIVRGAIYVGVAMGTDMRESLHQLVAHGLAITGLEWTNILTGMFIIGLTTLGSFLDQTVSTLSHLPKPGEALHEPAKRTEGP